MNIDLYQEYLATGRQAEALRLCEMALGVNPADANIWHLKGFAHRLLGQYPEAISAQERSLSLRPGEIPVLMALGVARQLSGDLEGALVEFRKVQAINPYYSGAYNSAALTREKMGDYRKAAELYEAAMQMLIDAFVLQMENSRESPYVPAAVLVGGDWWGLVMKPAMALAARARIKSIGMPSFETLDSEEVARDFGGMYWVDSEIEGESTRSFLPNFFQTVCLHLKRQKEYAIYAKNLSNVLHRLGEEEAAGKWLAESRAFSVT